MPPLAPRFDTLGYADDKGLDLIARCKRCGHQSAMNLSKLIGHFSWRTPFEQIEPRLRCRRCGARGATLTTESRRRVCQTCKRPL